MKSKLLCPLTRSNLMHLHIVAKITYCLSSHGEVEMEWSLEMWFHSTFLNVEHVRRLLLVLLLLLLLFGIWVKALAINLFQISDKCLIFGAEMNGFPYCSNSLSLSLSQSLDKPWTPKAYTWNLLYGWYLCVFISCVACRWLF